VNLTLQMISQCFAVIVSAWLISHAHAVECTSIGIEDATCEKMLVMTKGKLFGDRNAFLNEDKTGKPEATIITIGSSGDNKKCVNEESVYCSPQSGRKGFRENNDDHGDQFEISREGDQICARRVDAPDHGWGMDLKLRCWKKTDVVVDVSNSSENSKCVKVNQCVSCETGAGNKNSRLNNDAREAPDTFDITIKDGEVCSTRTDVNHGWGMHLEVNCVPCPTPAPTPPPPPTPEPTTASNECVGDCAYCKPHEGRWSSLPLCANGVYSWGCNKNNLGGKIQCPVKMPYMCAYKNSFCDSDYCCSKDCGAPGSELFKKFGGLRPCK